MHDKKKGNSQKTRYTFINMKRATTRNGSAFVGVTIEGLVCRPEAVRQVNDKLLLTFSIPIHNRGKYIESLCGMHPAENTAGVAWAQVSFWQDASAQNGIVRRLEHLLQTNQGKSLVLVITGSIKVVQNKGDAGRMYVNTNITGDDFILMRSFDRKEQPSQQDKQLAAEKRSEPQQTDDLGIPTGYNGQFYEIDEEDDDEEMPF